MSAEAVRPRTPEQHTFDLDGVRVHHFPSEEALTRAVLIFGVGHRDETLPTLGTLHALEHLVMDTVRRTPIEINASVDHTLTEFTAEGSPVLVTRFVEGACRGLADPPVDRLRAEADVLAAEAAEAETGSALTTARYGWRDLGVVGGPGPGPQGVGAEAVLAAARRWFVPANAVLIVDGPWLEGLRLPLPPGPRPAHAYVAPRRWSRPHALTADGPACALSLILPPADPTGIGLVAVGLLRARLTEVLRHERGLTYALDAELLAVADRCWDVIIESEPLPERIREAAAALIDTTSALLRDGPTETEMEAARAELLESTLGRDATISTVVDLAIGELLGSGLPRFEPEAVSALTREDLAGFLQALAGDVLYLVDEAAQPELDVRQIPVITGPPSVPGPLPAGDVFRPPLVALAVSKEARGAKIVLTDTGLVHQLGDEVWRLDWPEVAGVMRESEGDLVVFGLDGTVIPLGPGLYRRGQRLVEAVLAHVPAALVYDEAPASAGERR